uniref:Uncharacterized protein n=1 Tax=Glossina brevipalpis TaxID=37001 RepID=A0A1A9WN96_9MUSC
MLAPRYKEVDDLIGEDLLHSEQRVQVPCETFFGEFTEMNDEVCVPRFDVHGLAEHFAFMDSFDRGHSKQLPLALGVELDRSTKYSPEILVSASIIFRIVTLALMLYGNA